MAMVSSWLVGWGVDRTECLRYGLAEMQKEGLGDS